MYMYKYNFLQGPSDDEDDNALWVEKGSVKTTDDKPADDKPAVKGPRLEVHLLYKI